MMLLRLLVASLVLFSASVAMAQERALCATDGEALIAGLQKQFGEDVIAMAINNRGDMVRWLVDPNDRSWSMVVTMASGPGCLVAHGQDFDLVVNPSPTSIGDPS